jgi:transcription elongation factor GreA
MTTEARDLLRTEVVQLADDLRRLAQGDDQDRVAPDELIELPIHQAARRHARLQAVLDRAEVVDGAGVVAIGRRVTLREDDGTAVSYTVVAPGEGDPDRGAISADSPMGSALLRRTIGQQCQVAAPGGGRLVVVEGVE